MPDTGSPYNYGNEFLDTGASNLPPVATPAIDPALSPNQNTYGDSSTANIQAILKRDNPWLSSVQETTPINTRLDQTTRYDDPTHGYDPYNPNIEYQYGDRQSALVKWKNNILKFGANTAGAFLDAVATIPLVVNAAMEGDLSKVQNNSLTNSIQDWTAGLENSLPNYETTYEKNHPILNYFNPVNGSLGDSWGGVLKNLGYTVGSIAGALTEDVAIGALTGGLGDIPLVGVQFTKAFGKLGKVLGLGEKGAESLTTALQQGKKIEDVIAGMSTTNKIVDKTRYGLSLLTSATSEAMIEANQVMSELTAGLKKDYYDKHGFDATGSDADSIDTYSKTAGNAALLSNIALLTITEANMFGSLLKPAAAAKAGMEAAIDDGIKLKLQEGSKDIFEEAVNPKKGFKGIVNKFVNSDGVHSFGIEGFQEGAQFVIQNSSEDYYKRKYDTPSINATDNFVKSLSTGLDKVVNTREGLENILLGGLTGIIMSPITHFIEKRSGTYTSHQDRVQQVLQLLNNPENSLTGIFQAKYDAAVTADNINTDLNKSDNMYDYMNNRHQQLFNFVNAGIKTNRYDAQIQRLLDIKDLSENDKRALLGITDPNVTNQQMDSHIDNIVADAGKIKGTVDKVNGAFPNRFNSRSQADSYDTFEDYKKQLGVTLSQLNNNKDRIKSLESDISNITGADVNKLVDLTNYDGITKTIAGINERLKNLKVDEDLLKEGKSSEELKNVLKERKFLEDHLEILENTNNAEANRNASPSDAEPFINTIQSLYSFYNNQNINSKDKLDIIDTLQLYNQAQDIHKLGLSSDRAQDYFKKLTDKKGFDSFIKEHAASKQAFKDAVAEVLKNEENIPPLENSDDNEEIDDNGNPVMPKALNTSKIDEADIVDTSRPLDEFDVPFDEDKANAVLEANKKAAKVKKPKVDKKAQAETNQELSDLEKQAEGLIEENKKILKGQGMSEEDAQKSAQKQLDQTPTGKRINELKAQLNGEPVKTETTPVQEKPVKPATPTIVAATKGIRKYETNPFSLLNKVFTKNHKDGGEEERNLRDVVIKRTPSQIYNGITLKVGESTEKMKFGEYKPFPNTPNVYYTGYTHDISIMFEGKPLGKIGPSDRLFYKKDDKYINLSNITKEDYVNVTGNTIDTYDDFITESKAYVNAVKTIEDEFKAGKTEFSNADIKKLFNLKVSFGSIDLSKSASSDTLLKNLLYDKPGNVVLSRPLLFNTTTNTYERGEPTVIGKEKLDAVQYGNLISYLSDNTEKLNSFNSRYMFIAQMPNGEYTNISMIAARPAAINQGELDKLHGMLTRKITSKEVADNLNLQLKDNYYISDSNNPKGKGTNMFLSRNADGDVYLNIINKKLEYNRRLKMVGAEKAGSLNELIGIINNNIFAQTKKDSNLGKLNIVLNKGDIKTGILDDDNVTYEELKDKLNVAVQQSDPVNHTSHLLENTSLNVIPLNLKPKVTTETKTAPIAPVVKTEVKVETPQATKTSTATSQAFIKDKEAKTKARDEAKTQTKEQVDNDFLDSLGCI